MALQLPCMHIKASWGESIVFLLGCCMAAGWNEIQFLGSKAPMLSVQFLCSKAPMLSVSWEHGSCQLWQLSSFVCSCQRPTEPLLLWA